jgi:RNA polymerase sigma-70 factor (ECF subfamily)
LSPTLRTTIVLVILQGLSHKEAAVVLSASEGTIAWRIHEARRQLRREIERLQKEPTPSGIRIRARAVLAAEGVPADRLARAIQSLARV